MKSDDEHPTRDWGLTRKNERSRYLHWLIEEGLSHGFGRLEQNRERTPEIREALPMTAFYASARVHHITPSMGAFIALRDVLKEDPYYSEERYNPNLGLIADALLESEQKLWKRMGIATWGGQLDERFGYEINERDDPEDPEERPRVREWDCTPEEAEDYLQDLAWVDEANTDMLPLVRHLVDHLTEIGDKGKDLADKLTERYRDAGKTKENPWYAFGWNPEDTLRIRYWIARALWFDVVQPELERFKGKHPAMPKGIAEVFVEVSKPSTLLWTRSDEEKPGEVSKSTKRLWALSDGENPQILVGNKAQGHFVTDTLIEQLRRHNKIVSEDTIRTIANARKKALSSVYGGKLIRWLIGVGFTEYMNGQADQDVAKIRIIGGLAEITKRLHFDGNSKSARGRVESALEALEAMRLSGPGLDSAWFLAVDKWKKSAPGRRSEYEITLNWPMLPIAANRMKRAGGNPLLVLVQSPGVLQIASERQNDKGKEYNLNFRVNMHATDKSRERYESGAIELSRSDWERMMDESEVPNKPELRERIIDGYYSPATHKTGLFPIFDALDGDREQVKYHDPKADAFHKEQGQIRSISSKNATARTNAGRKRKPKP